MLPKCAFHQNADVHLVLNIWYYILSAFDLVKLRQPHEARSNAVASLKFEIMQWYIA